MDIIFPNKPTVLSLDGLLFPRKENGVCEVRFSGVCEVFGGGMCRAMQPCTS